MRLINLSKGGIRPVIARKVFSSKFQHDFYSVSHGELGKKDRWQIRLPIPRSEYAPSTDAFDTEGVEFKLVDLHKQDAAGQACYMLERGKPDKQYLVLLEAERVDLVSASGACELLPAVGHGLHDKYFMFLLTGPAGILVKRRGRVSEGEAVEFGLTFDGVACRSKRRFIFDEEELRC